jgi:GAF domain-containing protein
VAVKDEQPKLQRITERLLEQTGASRTTVRGRAGDDPVALLAESLAPGVESMADGQQPAAIVAAPTYAVLSATREILVQDNCRDTAPEPPRSLIERYRVYAQMLAPVLDGGDMIATISVHQQDTTRHWTDEDIAALRRAQGEVTALLANGADPSD